MHTIRKFHTVAILFISCSPFSWSFSSISRSSVLPINGQYPGSESSIEEYQSSILFDNKVRDEKNFSSGESRNYSKTPKNGFSQKQGHMVVGEVFVPELLAGNNILLRADGDTNGVDPDNPGDDGPPPPMLPIEGGLIVLLYAAGYLLCLLKKENKSAKKEVTEVKRS